jgi:hypothetical protein
VIGVLRFVGMMNVGVWLGAALFYTLSAGPAMVSPEMQTLLGPRNFTYFSGAVSQILLAKYFHLHLACATIALLHLLVEWLYLGRAPRRIWVSLLAALFWLSVVGSFWIGPKLRDLHRAQHKMDSAPGLREAAAKSFQLWNGIFEAVNVSMIVCIGIYFWRAAHPPDELRFVGSPKFRG